jgi:hypothetical protein
MGVVANRVVTDALIAELEAADLAVGDGEQPTGSGWQGAAGLSSFVPYAVVHALAGGNTDGPISAPDDDADSLYQITGVGATREQAEAVGDVARVALCAPGALTVTGRSVCIVRVDVLNGCRRDDTVEPVVFITTDRFRVTTTPA